MVPMTCGTFGRPEAIVQQTIARPFCGDESSAARRWVVTTRLGLPAVLWYGDLMTPILIAEHSSSESECGTTRLRDRLEGRPRVLAYLGFQDFPAWFDDQLLQTLTDGGSVLAMRHFGSLSRAAVVALDAPAG